MSNFEVAIANRDRDMERKRMHDCDERCSWKQTPMSLIALGFETIIPASDATPMEKATAEQSFRRARNRAVDAGKLRLCTRTDRVRAETG